MLIKKIQNEMPLHINTFPYQHHMLYSLMLNVAL